jgi:DNA-binding CsgD family transcriptional regulator
MKSKENRFILRNSLLLVFVLLMQGYYSYTQTERTSELQDSIKSISSPYKKVNLLFELGDIFTNEEQYLKAIEQHKNALLLGERVLSDSIIHFAKAKLGLLFYYTGNLKQSVFYLRDALEFFELSGDQKNILAVKQNLANLFVRLNYFDEAERLLKEVKAEILLQEDSAEKNLNIFKVSNNLGNLFYNSGDIDSALHYFLAAENFLDVFNNDYLSSIINSNLSTVFLNLKMYDEALSYALLALQQGEEADSKAAIAAAYSGLGRYYYFKNDYANSLHYLMLAQNLFQKNNDLYNQVEVAGNLVTLYQAKGDTVKAFKEQQQFVILKDSLMGVDLVNILESANLEFQLRKERDRIIQIENEARIMEKERKLSSLRFYFAIIGNFLLIVVILLAIYTFRSKIQKKKLREELLLKEKENLNQHLNYKQNELQSFSNFILEKNKLLENLKDEIREINKIDNEVRAETNKIIQLIDNSIQIDESKQEIVAKADETNKDLMFHLDTQFPSLTKTEKRLCSLLILDISNKEIALLMGIEPETVKGYKKKVRKKLALPPYADVSDYLKQLGKD